MKILLSKELNRAMTLLELMVILAVITVLATLILPGLMRPHRVTVCYIQCVNNLKQIGLAARIWEGDNNDKYPWAVSTTNGGTMELRFGLNAFRTFQAMSNELSTPKVVLCPKETDKYRSVAANFFNFNNSNISFFVGVDANEGRPTMILSGDHNITNGLRLRNGLLDLITNGPAGWTAEVHNKVGNILLADGSVQQMNTVGLRTTIAKTGLPTNWLQMPIVQ